MIFERPTRHLNVFKRHGVIGELLIIFVTFARDQDDVTRLRDFDCLGNRLRAVGDFFKMIAEKTFFDFGYALIWIFFSRIVWIVDDLFCDLFFYLTLSLLIL